MSDFLTEKAVFECSAQPAARIGVAASGNVSFRGGKVLTNSDRLVLKTSPGVCSVLSKGPNQLPCAFAQAPVSILSGSAQNVSASTPLLLANARGPCPMAPLASISLASHSDTQNVFRELSSGAGSGNSAAPGESGASSASGQSASTPGQAPANAAQPDGTADKSLTPKDKASKQPNPLASKVLACQKRCSAEERRKCEARKALKEQWRQKPFRNDSNLLGRNYKKRIGGKDESTEPVVTAGHKAHELYTESGKARETCKEKNKLAADPWGYAAHHILSGNEILLPAENLLQMPAAKDMPDLFALIRIAGFDINDADNCIMLPGVNYKNKEDPHGQRPDARKREAAFETMASSRLQWHCSKHGYDIAPYVESLRSALKVRHLAGREREIRNYRDLLMERFGKLVKPYKKAPICPKEDRQRLEKFVQDLKQEIEVIRQELIRFAEKPHRSFPYFVSMEAWRYAFLLPRVSKIIAITRSGESYKFQQFRLTRFAATLAGKEGEQLAVNEVGKSGVKSGELVSVPGPATMHEYIRFCDGYDLFALGEGVGNRVTGFEIPEDRVFRIPGLDAKKELADRDASLLVWLLDKAQDEDAPACPSAFARLREARNHFANLECDTL